MTKTARNVRLTLLMPILLPVLASCSGKAPEKPASGPDLFVQACGTQGVPDPRCLSRGAIEKAFGFDLMAEIDERYRKMKKTAGEIAAGKLTDEAYKACLSDGSCEAVPMLDNKLGDKTPHAREISHTFWALADGHYLSPGICKSMTICAVALENGVLAVRKNRIVAAKEKQP